MPEVFNVSGNAKIVRSNKIVLNEKIPVARKINRPEVGQIFFSPEFKTDCNFEIQFTCKVTGKPEAFGITLHSGDIPRQSSLHGGNLGIYPNLNILSIKFYIDAFKTKLQRINFLGNINTWVKDSVITDQIVETLYRSTSGRHEYAISYADKYFYFFIDGELQYRVPLDVRLATNSNTVTCTISGETYREAAKITVKDYNLIKDCVSNQSKTREYLKSNRRRIVLDKDIFKCFFNGSEYVNIYGKYLFFPFSIHFMTQSHSFTLGFLNKLDGNDGVYISYQPGKFRYYIIKKGKNIDYTRCVVDSGSLEPCKVLIIYSSFKMEMEFYLNDKRILYFRTDHLFSDSGFVKLESIDNIKEIHLNLPRINEKKCLLNSLPSELIALTNSFLNSNEILGLNMISIRNNQIYSQKQIWIDLIKEKYCNFDINFDEDIEISNYLVRYFCGFSWSFLSLLTYYKNYHLYLFDYLQMSNYVKLINENRLNFSCNQIYGMDLYNFKNQNDQESRSLSLFKNIKILKLRANRDDVIFPALTNFKGLKVLIVMGPEKIIPSEIHTAGPLGSLLYLNINSSTFDLSKLCSIKFEKLLYLKIKYEGLTNPGVIRDISGDISRDYQMENFFKRDYFPKLTLLSINDCNDKSYSLDPIVRSIIESRLPIKYMECNSCSEVGRYITPLLFGLLQLPKLEKLGIPSIDKSDLVKLKTAARELKISVFSFK